MRIRDFSAVALCLAAVPALAQQAPKDVTGPWTLNADLVTCTDLPIVTRPIPRLVVKGPQAVDDRLGNVTGQTVVIGRGPDDGLAVGQRYTTSRLNRDPKYFPHAGEGYGGLRVTGFITVTAINQWNALAHVDFSCDAVQTGDYLEPYVEGSIPSSAAPELYPDFDNRAQILFGADNRTLVGMGDIVSIDRGTTHGVTAGARYAVYRDKLYPNGSGVRLNTTMFKSGDVAKDTPLVYLGDVVVMSTSETTSKVIVVKSVDGIMNGDTVVPRTLKEPKQ